MKHVFYLIGIAFIIYEWLWIVSPKSRVEKSKQWDEEHKKNKGKNKWDDYTQEYKDLLISKGLPSILFFLWMICGLMTFNWVAFLAIILFNMIVIAPISKAVKFSSAYTVLHWFNSVLGFAFGVFVILNSYHLKVDLYAWLLGWL